MKFSNKQRIKADETIRQLATKVDECFMENLDEILERVADDFGIIPSGNENEYEHIEDVRKEFIATLKSKIYDETQILDDLAEKLYLGIDKTVEIYKGNN